jgi:hypothetical protein
MKGTRSHRFADSVLDGAALAILFTTGDLSVENCLIRAAEIVAAG